MKPCLFCEIIAGARPAHKVFENQHVVAFLDHRPLFPGHVLVVPRTHRETLGDLEAPELKPLLEVVRLFSQSMKRALGAQGSFVANNNIVSQSVPHLHWHVVPRTKGDGMKGFFWPRQPYASEQHMHEVRERLSLVALQEEVLDFWFGPLDASGVSADFYSSRWFKVDEVFDEEIRSRFSALIDSALAGDLQEWCAESRGRLALILILDQLTRHRFRNTAASVSGDDRALALCLQGLAEGVDQELAADQRVFYNLPLQHAESAEAQDRSLSQFSALLDGSSPAHRPRYENFLDCAQRQADVIFRFGRDPHRNQVLGRKSTPAEELFFHLP